MCEVSVPGPVFSSSWCAGICELSLGAEANDSNVFQYSLFSLFSLFSLYSLYGLYGLYGLYSIYSMYSL